MFDLLEEYRETLRMVQRAQRIADKNGDGLSKSGLGSAATNLRYIIHWLETGYPPKANEDITKLSYEQREVPVDPALICRYWIAEAAPYKADENMRDFFDDVMESAGVTEREKEALLKVRALGWSFQETAEWMGIAKTSVQNHVERAEKKIRLVVQRKKDAKVPQPELKKPVQRVMFL